MGKIEIVGRPKTATDEMLNNAAGEVFDSIISSHSINANDFESREDAIFQLKEAYQRAFGRNGYDIAKELDSRFGWEPDAEIVEHLDSMDYAVSKQIESAQKRWAEETNVQPPIPNGERVKAKWGRETIYGTIDRVYEYGPAKYCVKRDGETGTSRAIINFEDVERIAENGGIPGE